MNSFYYIFLPFYFIEELFAYCNKLKWLISTCRSVHSNYCSQQFCLVGPIHSLKNLQKKLESLELWVSKINFYSTKLKISGRIDRDIQGWRQGLTSIESVKSWIEVNFWNSINCLLPKISLKWYCRLQLQQREREL